MAIKATGTGNRKATPTPLPWWIWLLPLGTLAFKSIMFLGMNWTAISIDWWFLSFVSLVPWLIPLVKVNRSRSIYLASYGLGVIFYFINTSYIWAITKPGYFALCLYFGVYYLLFAIVVRPVYLRWKLPLALLVPIAWVAAEFLRGIGPLAFPFLFLAHGVYRQLALIQISDVVGAYGVSFVIAMVNGLVADWILNKLHARHAKETMPKLFGPTLATLLVIAGTLFYGVIQLSRNTMSKGPKIAVLQADYPLSVDLSENRVPSEKKAEAYLDLMIQAAEEKPDLFLFPETPWDMCLNDEFLQASDIDSDYITFLQPPSLYYEKILREGANAYNAYVVIGAGAMEFYPTEVYPKSKKYNSAFVFAPKSEDKWRYDKVELVMFGEYTPFRYGRLHQLYRWLDRINPLSKPEDEFSLTPGESFSTFEMVDHQGRKYRFGIPICFEDLIPKVSRKFTIGPDGKKRVDFLLSISNDGWFNHGALVPQHLAVCAFRAVENRVGIARSVNTACSGFINPNGYIHHVVTKNGRTLGREIFGYKVANVMTDIRRSLYSRFGDWFGSLCVILALVALVLSQFKRKDIANTRSAK